MLDHAGQAVGVLLLIYSARGNGPDRFIRCNLSSWYVMEGFRAYAGMLTARAQRHRDVLYINISPALWTWPLIEAQGFRPYCGGVFFSLPALSRVGGVCVKTIPPGSPPVRELPEEEAALLARHAGYGCLCILCHAPDGHISPFVLQPMRYRGLPLPAMQMIYCRDVTEYIACAGAIGRFLLKRGHVSVALDADGRVGTMFGLYRAPFGRKYFKGPRRPKLADLSDTELVIYGP
jgi:hypothetical protein